MQLGCLMVVLNVAELSQALSDFYTGFYSIMTVYWVTRFLLTCLHAVLNVAELSQALADMYAGWFYSICMQGDFTLSELSTE